MKINYPKLILFITIPLLVGFLGSFFTSSISTWYSLLNKPFFSPPNWLFGPVWIILYIMMGIASYLVSESKKNKKAMKFYWIQLTLNGLWTPLFFGLKSPLAGLIGIITLILVLIITIKEFRKVNVTAFYLMVPYILWVSFATLLNVSILLLN